MPFFSRNDFIDWCMGTLSANWGVPDHISKEFFTELINKFLDTYKAQIMKIQKMDLFIWNGIILKSKLQSRKKVFLNKKKMIINY